MKTSPSRIAYIQSESSTPRFELPKEYEVRTVSLKELSEKRTLPEIVALYPMKRVPSAEKLELLNVLISTKPEVSPHFEYLVIPWMGARSPDGQKLRKLLAHFEYPERVEVVNKPEISNVEFALKQAFAKALTSFTRYRDRTAKVENPRRSLLDSVRAVMESSADLREESGRLSAKRVADVFGLKQKELAEWAGISAARLNRTPDAEYLQPMLGFFERIARLRIVLKDDATFRKWLRTSLSDLGSRSPLELLKEKQWQVLADYVDDILTGAPG